MGFFDNKKNTAIDELHNRLTSSFANVKDDISGLKRNEQLYQQWIQYMHQKILVQDRLIHDLMAALKEKPAIHEVHQLVNEHPRFEQILKRIEVLNNQVDDMLLAHDPMVSRIREHHERIGRLEAQHVEKKPTLREKIVSKVNRNSKDYVKGFILSLINKYSRVSGLQLREIVVEEQGLCSKSSFYRLLDEIDSSRDAQTMQDGKDKIYLAKSVVQKQSNRT